MLVIDHFICIFFHVVILHACCFFFEIPRFEELLDSKCSTHREELGRPTLRASQAELPCAFGPAACHGTLDHVKSSHVKSSQVKSSHHNKQATLLGGYQGTWEDTGRHPGMRLGPRASRDCIPRGARPWSCNPGTVRGRSEPGCKERTRTQGFKIVPVPGPHGTPLWGAKYSRERLVSIILVIC